MSQDDNSMNASAFSNDCDERDTPLTFRTKQQKARLSGKAYLT